MGPEHDRVFPCRVVGGGGHVAENGGGRPRIMSGLPTLGSKRQSSRASKSVIYPAERNGINERKQGAADGGGRNHNNRAFGYRFTEVVGHRAHDAAGGGSRKMDGTGIKDDPGNRIEQREDLRRTKAQLLDGGMDDASSSSGANSNPGGLFNPEPGCSSSSSDRLQSDNVHCRSSRGSGGGGGNSGRMLENATAGGVFGNMRSSSSSSSSYRSSSSACNNKRKSCTPSVTGSLSCGRGSLRNGFRENSSSNGGRTARITGTSSSRRSSTTMGGIGGCASALDVFVVSTSSSAHQAAAAAAVGRSSELPDVTASTGIEEELAAQRATTSLREALDLMPETPRAGSSCCSGKSAAASSSRLALGKSSQRNPRGSRGGGGVGLLLAAEAGASSLPFCTASFAQTLHRRSAPVMTTQHENSGSSSSSQRIMLSSDAHRNPNDAGNARRSRLLVHNEILTTSTSTRCHSGGRSSSVGGSSSSSGISSSSPRRRNTSTLGLAIGGGGERLSHRYMGRSRTTHSLPTTSVSTASQLGAATDPSMSGHHHPGPSSHPSPSPSSSVSHPSVMAETAPSIDSLSSSSTSHFLQRSLLSRTSSSLAAAGVRETTGFSLSLAGDPSLLGTMSFRHGLQLSAGNGTQHHHHHQHPPHLVAEGLAEIISALEHVERDEDLTYEQLLMLEATLLFGGLRLQRDQHSDLRLDVDNMSYEELLALEDRIGNVSTGLTAEAVAEKLKRRFYSSLDVMAGAQNSHEFDIKCSICQEEYEDGDELGKIECGHGYHVLCIQQWLVHKNQCPICKSTAFA